MNDATPRLIGGIHRDVSGRIDEPLRFFVTVDRKLASGRLDSITVGEAEILTLVEQGAAALQMLARERGGRS